MIRYGYSVRPTVSDCRTNRSTLIPLILIYPNPVTYNCSFVYSYTTLIKYNLVNTYFHNIMNGYTMIGPLSIGFLLVNTFFRARDG